MGEDRDTHTTHIMGTASNLENIGERCLGVHLRGACVCVVVVVGVSRASEWRCCVADALAAFWRLNELCFILSRLIKFVLGISACAALSLVDARRSVIFSEK